MKKEPVLVVMAAGMGSRYGGLKQIDPVGSQGEAILDYSLYDAWQAGFKTAVIIIKKAIHKDFMDTVGQRLKKCPLEIRYAYQELDMLPAGYTVPEGRTKPWGTTHAVLCAKDAIDGAPFVALNADDYYGKAAFKTAYDALCSNEDETCCFMMGFQIGNTVTENGAVTRAICDVDRDGYLAKIVECRGVEKYEGGIRLPTSSGGWYQLQPETPVSMNMWGLTPLFLDACEARFPVFLDSVKSRDSSKGEFLLPISVGHMIEDNTIRVKVLSTPDSWFGVTYAADKPKVVAALKALTDAGLYPDGLWK